MNPQKMTSAMLWAELEALKDILADGGLSRAEWAYLNAIKDEINRRFEAEGCNVRVL